MKTFDYIIIGAGSAGCVLANRLSAESGKSVALVEAGGGDRNLIFRLPIMAGGAYWYKPSNWGYETEPQAHLDGRRIAWPRGKVLGGSSTINGMMYMRGARADYDRWARDEGCPGWSYQEVLPYFLRGEDAPGTGQGTLTTIPAANCASPAPRGAIRSMTISSPRRPVSGCR